MHPAAQEVIAQAPEAPKPINTSPNKKIQKFDVHLGKKPKIGSVYFKVSETGVEFYQVANVGRYRSFGRADRYSIVYWIRQRDGKLFASGVKKANLKPINDWECLDQYADEDMHTNVAQNIRLTKRPKIKKGMPKVGEFRTVTIMHKNPRQNYIIEKYRRMQVWHHKSKMKKLYWRDKQGTVYWSEEHSTEVREMPNQVDPNTWLEKYGFDTVTWLPDRSKA